MRQRIIGSDRSLPCTVAAAALLLLGAAAPAANATAAPAAANGFRVRIRNPPPAILVGQTWTLKADGRPEGGAYSWKVKSGTAKVDPDLGTGQTFEFTGTEASGSVDDVEIEVDYGGAKASCRLTVVEMKLKSVGFGGSGFHVVTPDRGAGSYIAPHWLDQDGDGDATDTAGDRRFPVLYERASRVTVNRLTATVAPAGIQIATVNVRGRTSDNHRFTGSGAAARGTLTVGTAMTADTAVPNTVWFYDTYDVDWEVTLTEEGWRPIGTSDNRVYVSLARPAVATLHETVCELACGSASGANSPQRAADLMWAELSDRDVRRKPLDGLNRRDGQRMGYWRPNIGNCQTLAQMLASPIGNGTCAAWAQLLVAMTRVHGIQNASSRLVEIVADPTVNVGATGFLVKRWAFRHEFVHTGLNGINNSDTRLDDRDFVRKNRGYPFTVCIGPGIDQALQTLPAGDDMVAGNEITTGPDGVCNTVAAKGDVQVIRQDFGQPRMPCILGGPDDKIDSTINPDDGKVTTPNGKPPYPFIKDLSAINLPGIPGQDNPDPPGFFGNHYVVKLLGRIYDPSYGGIPYATEKEHEDASIDGILSGNFARRSDTTRRELLYTPR